MRRRLCASSLLCALLSLLSGPGCAPPEPDDSMTEMPALSPMKEAVKAPLLYPTPRHARVEDTAIQVERVCIDLSALPGSKTLSSLLGELAEGAGLQLTAPSAECPFRLRFISTPPTLTGPAAAVWQRASTEPERALIVPDARAPDLLLYAASEGAALQVLRRALSLVVEQSGRRFVRQATVIDFPGFPERGIVEGFYGTYYTRSERQLLMQMMGRLGMNTYVYGPKNDPYSHERWADPHPAEDAAALRAAAAFADSHLISFRWAISPARGGEAAIKYSSDADFERFKAKLESVRKLGISRFAVFLDDIAEGLYWPEDRARFPTLADAHASFLKRVSEYLRSRDPTTRLLAVGTFYSNQQRGWQTYSTVLGQEVPLAVDLMWTGPYVYSLVIQASHLTEVNSLLKRKVYLWDNAPQDLAPINRRSADLSGMVSGYVFNPVVNEGRALTPRDFFEIVGPQGDFLWNPNDYDPLASFVSWYQIRRQRY